MKIIGMMLTWNNFEFFRCALNQALEFCDEVIVVEGNHMVTKEYPKHSIDYTCEQIESMRGHPKLTIIDDWNFTGLNNKIQWAIRSTYTKESPLWKPGNWIIQWDDDMFFFDDDLKKIKEILKNTDHDTLLFRERRFAFNFRFNLLAEKNDLFGHNMQKIKEGCYYMPNWKLHYETGELYSDVLNVPEITYFHYPYVKPTKRMKHRWDISVQKGETYNSRTKNMWDKFSWKKDEDIFQKEREFRTIIGGKGKLNIYNSKHPQALSYHPWRFINDVREVL